METNAVRLYAFGYTDWKTYLWTAVFIVCNMLLPQLAHLIPQGGIIFAPLSFVILAGSYKFGWKAGLLAAVLSPVVNHLVFGMPEWAMAQVMVVKLSVLALLAGWAALRFQPPALGRRGNGFILIGCRGRGCPHRQDGWLCGRLNHRMARTPPASVRHLRAAALLGQEITTNWGLKK